jgi:hypothetical protein
VSLDQGKHRLVTYSREEWVGRDSNPGPTVNTSAEEARPRLTKALFFAGLAIPALSAEFSKLRARWKLSKQNANAWPASHRNGTRCAAFHNFGMVSRRVMVARVPGSLFPRRAFSILARR